MTLNALESEIVKALKGLDPEGKGYTSSGSRLTLDLLTASQNKGPGAPNRAKVKDATESLERKGLLKIHDNTSGNPIYELI